MLHRAAGTPALSAKQGAEVSGQRSEVGSKALTPTLSHGERVEVSLAEQLACARRELALRRNTYPRQVAAGRLTPATAARETAALAAIVETLERCLLLEEVSAEMRTPQP